MQHTKSNIKYISVTLLLIIIINAISSAVYQRFDLTNDQRYTLSQTTEQLVTSLNQPLILDVFLEGNLPSEFKLLQRETKQLIEEFKALNPRINVNYIDPLADEASQEENIRELTRSGLEPYVNSKKVSGKITQELIFPWAFASYNNKTVKVPLFKKNITDDLQTQVAIGVQQLEYHFADALKQLTTKKSKRIAILKGNGQLDDRYIADFLKTIGNYYYIAPFTLDSVATNASKTLNDLKQYDLIISAKPTQAFTEYEKLVLDQYTMNGGKSIWLTEAMAVDKDSLYNASGSTVSLGRDLNLNDFFFQYGVRINQNLIKDLYSAPISLAIGEGNNTQFQPVQWQYSPLGISTENHPISKHLDVVKFDFASQIDTLKNTVKKTVLLQSSGRSQLEGSLQPISLASVTKPVNPKLYNSGKQSMAVLLEGTFNSVYKNRILPFELKTFSKESKPTQMVVVSDGDVIKNDVSRNRPLQLGFERITGRTYSNKEFLLNTVNYLLDDTGLIAMRAKSLSIAFLDSEKVDSYRQQWQFIVIGLPLILLGIFGYVFNYFRRRNYSR